MIVLGRPGEHSHHIALQYEVMIRRRDDDAAGGYGGAVDRVSREQVTRSI